MNRANLWRASLLMVGLTAAACGQEDTPASQPESTLGSRQDAISQHKALILARTVTGGENSVEAQAAQQFGMQVKVVDDAEWGTMSAADFATYRVIILGDASCANLDAVSAAVANRHVWGRAVNGNVFIAGTAPVANGAPELVTQRAVRFASSLSGMTGLYISLSCYYQDAAPNTHVELLEPFGDFAVQSGACHDTVHIVSDDPDLSALQDETMSNWPCSVNAQFDSFPAADFAPWSIATYPTGARGASPGVREFYDGAFGAPYILARGAVLQGCGNYDQDIGEACDHGNESNGLANQSCSATCQFNWCGNGVLDEGEDCDEGWRNGTSVSACPRSCRVLPAPPPSNRPPLALCRNVTLSAGPTCGGVGASINNGSSDPDGNLVGCEQSVTTFEAGLTTVSLTCTDTKGLSASCSSSVTVVDDIAPTISCPEASTFECGVGSAQLTPAEAQDNCTAPTLKHAMAGEGFALGAERQVTWTASDGENEASCSTTVKMVDTLAPSLALEGAGSVALECGVGQYKEEGATATDTCAGDLSAKVAISGSVDPAARGSYAVTYSVADAAGNTASAVRAVSVNDTLAPSISLLGAQTMKLECGRDSFTNPGATASDACSGDLSAKVAISGAVNTAAVGSYPVRYEVKDAANLSASAVRTVQVEDTLAPSISLKGASSLALECGVGQYTEAGVTATDVCAGDLSAKVAISGTVNTAARGSYQKTYSVADAAGNAASAVRTVSVNDTLAPTLALVGSATMKLECGVDSFTNPGATAVDACAGNLTSAITTSGAVNTAVVGSYAVSYRVADAAGLSTSAVRTVQVADTLAPSLALNGASTLTLECGVGQYTEAGATATDVCAGNLSAKVAISGTVNTAARGTYRKTYSVADASGNTATLLRTVNVTDTKAPVITLVGSANMTIDRGTPFTDPGATAADSCSGNLTSAIVKTGSVNSSVVGTYTLRYTVTDGAGLSSTVTRFVKVEEACDTEINVKPVQQIWPPNHSYQSFRLSHCASVTSSCGSGGGCHGDDADINEMGTILSIYSDEVEDATGNGDGNTDDDIVITGPSSFKLRAERQGKGNGRVYGIRFKVTDSSGAVQTATCKFAVPHDQGDRNVVDNGAAAGYTVNAPNW
ncbi:DUF5011 domain-containing protein [Hyalangium gracile]|uniref:DUF5011 domain-containing protein n=1 Tax=Hyalangium gracile TaxID=394092 RepID=UPI001CCDADFB|nr:DUF5011 domain-containing protein [Hyalangium gracile]